MELFEANGNVYGVDEDGACHGVGVTARDKVVEVRELESVTIKPLKEEVVLPPQARPITVDAIVKKFALSQRRPVKFSESRHAQALPEGDAGEADGVDAPDEEDATEGDESPESEE